MKLDSNIQSLDNSYYAFKHQLSYTQENWNDIVQRKFYKQFIELAQNDFEVFISELNNLNHLFGTLQNLIDDLEYDS